MEVLEEMFKVALRLWKKINPVHNWFFRELTWNWLSIKKKKRVYMRHSLLVPSRCVTM